MPMNIVGVVLAGGQSTRMLVENKCFLPLGDKTLLGQVIKRALPQVDKLLLNINGDGADFASYGLEIIPDIIEGHAGPLAGILSALMWIQHNHPDCSHLATFPVDSPFCPPDLVSRLANDLQSNNTQISIPRFGAQSHWVFGLWSLSLIPTLQTYLIEQQQRKVQSWIKGQSLSEVSFDDYDQDPFFNINTPEDFDIAKKQWQLLAY